MYQKTNQIFLSFSLLLVSLLPGCTVIDWLHDKFGSAKPVTVQKENSNSTSSENSIFVPEDGSKVLASMNGRPLVTEKSLALELKALGDANQEVKMMLSLYGEDEIKRGLVQRKVASALYERFLQEQGIQTSKEYQQELARLIDTVKEQFNQMYFLKAIPVTVTEKEKRDWYEQNKDAVPNLKISEGGVKASGVLFETEDKAKKFLANLKDAKYDLAKAAEKAQLPKDQIKDFNVVNPQSLHLDEGVRSVITGMNTFPSAELVKTDKGYWVVVATGKEETKYRSYDQIANEITQLIERIKRTEAAEKKIEELRKKFNVAIADELEKKKDSMESDSDDVQGAAALDDGAVEMNLAKQA